MTDRNAEHGPDSGTDAEAGRDVEVVTVRDRFLAAGISPEHFEGCLAAGRIAVAGERIGDPATPAPHPTAVAIMLDLE